MTRGGLIGVGKMGKPIARHILAKGFPLTVYDIVRTQMDDAVARGAKAAASLQQVGADSDVILILVGYEEETWDAARAVATGAQAGAVLVISSTVSPETVQAIAAELQPKGIRVVDAPIARGEKGAVEGNALVMVGGDEAAVVSCRPVLAAFATDIVRVGEVGAGQVAKTVNNLLLWACKVANYEALRLASRYGADLETLRKVILMGSGANSALNDIHHHTTMPWANKDMTLVLEMAERTGVVLPLAGLLKELVRDPGVRRLHREGWTFLQSLAGSEKEL